MEYPLFKYQNGMPNNIHEFIFYWLFIFGKHKKIILLPHKSRDIEDVLVYYIWTETEKKNEERKKFKKHDPFSIRTRLPS